MIGIKGCLPRFYLSSDVAHGNGPLDPGFHVAQREPQGQPKQHRCASLHHRADQIAAETILKFAPRELGQVPLSPRRESSPAKPANANSLAHQGPSGPSCSGTARTRAAAAATSTVTTAIAAIVTSDDSELVDGE